MKETLVILAAGMGSRYGGLKQIDTVGSNGESIIDFTIYDAIQAGFKKLVLIIRKEHEEAFEEHLVKKIRPFIEVEYVYQDLHDIPEGVEIPEGREKPWGTTHALLACRNTLKDDPFVVCNADDFYGRDAFNKAMTYFNNNKDDKKYAMVSYKVANTLSENGTVTRAVCEKDNNDYLTSIVEVMNIKKGTNGPEYEENGEYKPMDPDTPVSMNFWCFYPTIMPELLRLFRREIVDGIKKNPLKYEALLPNHAGVLINEGKCKIKVLTSIDKWFGVTYKEDKPTVVANIQEKKDNGIYPDNLWK